MRRPMLLPILALALACGGEPTVPNSGFEWPRTGLAQAGLDSARFDAMVRHIEQDLPNLNALVVVRGGALAFEWYLPGRDGFHVYDTHSITKSWVATYVGIALQRGWIASLDQPIITFFPEIVDDRNADPRIGDVTLRHLMTMSSGIEEEGSNRFPSGTRDLVRKLLRTPLVHDPGTAFLYDGANPHILSGMVHELTGQSLAELARDGLFRRMNMEHGAWTGDEDGVSNGGTGLLLGALDLAKLGELYLRDGVWLGERILPPGFAELAAGTVHFALDGAFADYGMLWWTAEYGGHRLWIAAGYRGQFVVVAPGLDLVAVIQSESYQPRGDIEDHLHLVINHVLPAAE